MPFLTLLLLAVPLFYAAFLVYFIFLLLKKPAVAPINTTAQKLPGISIVIPFRNEADNLSRLIDSLDAQTHAGDFEILLVNDGSADRYNEAINSRSQPRNRPLPQLRVIDSHYAPLSQLTSKQQALDHGIKEAKHEWIALTDADMVFSPEWLETLIKPAIGGAGLVFGHTAVVSDRKKYFLAWFQSFQLETLFSFAYALHRAGITGSCMGNNILISKEAYLNIGGFESIGRSIVEDRDLMAAFRRNRIPVAVTEPFYPTAFTRPCATLRSYLHQVLRWTKGGFRIQSILSFFGILLCAHTAIFLCAAAGMLSHEMTLFLFVNQLTTWAFIAISFGKIRSNASALLFPLFFALFLVEAVIIGISFTTGKRILWKERKL